MRDHVSKLMRQRIVVALRCVALRCGRNRAGVGVAPMRSRREAANDCKRGVRERQGGAWATRSDEWERVRVL
jgi:hypothetical protein